MSKNKYLILILLLAGFFAVRLPILFTSIHKLYDDQELYIGTIAKELIEGPALALFDYQWDHTKGGTLVWGVLAIPFFLVFGQTYISLKLLAIFSASVILALSYLFLWKFFDKRTALIYGILTILSPPLYTKFSLMIYGRHFETILFTTTILFLFYKIFFDESLSVGVRDAESWQEKAYAKKKFYFAAFGLASGFGLYFDYILFVFLAACLLFWFAFDKRFILRKSSILFFVFFLIGFSPWVYYNITHNFASVSIDDNVPGRPLKELFLSHMPLESLNKLKILLVRDLPNSFYFEDFKNVPGSLICYLYYLIFVISFIALFWMNRKVMFRLVSGMINLRKHIFPSSEYRQVFILTCTLIFFLIYSFTPYEIRVGDDEFQGFYGYRKLIVLYPLVYFIISLFLSWLWKQKNHRTAFIAFLSAMLFLVSSGITANYGLITPQNFGRSPIYEGYCYEELGQLIGKRFGNDIKKTVSLADKIDTRYRAFVFRGIGFNVGWRFYHDTGKCTDQINMINSKYRPYILEGLGQFLGWKFKDHIRQAVDFANQADKEDRCYIYGGIGQIVGWRFGYRMNRIIEKINEIDSIDRFYCYLGLGEAISARFRQNVTQCVGFSEKIEPAYQGYFFEGMGVRLGWIYKHYLKEGPQELIEKIPKPYQPFFIKGLQKAGQMAE